MLIECTVTVTRNLTAESSQRHRVALVGKLDRFEAADEIGASALLVGRAHPQFQHFFRSRRNINDDAVGIIAIARDILERARIRAAAVNPICRIELPVGDTDR
jgi:hypothetical protein